MHIPDVGQLSVWISGLDHVHINLDCAGDLLVVVKFCKDDFEVIIEFRVVYGGLHSALLAAKTVGGCCGSSPFQKFFR